MGEARFKLPMTERTEAWLAIIGIYFLAFAVVFRILQAFFK